MKSAVTRVFGPYSPVRKAGNLYFLAGHIGVDPITGHAPADIREQTSQLLSNMSTTLAAQGLKLDDIAKTTVYLTNMDDFAGMNEVYTDFFASPRPARSTVAVHELPRVADMPLKVEIEAIAVKGMS